MNSKQIKLGQKVVDSVTGFKGIAYQMVEHLGGTLQFAVQPAGKGDTIPEAQNIDAETLTVTGEGVSASRVAPAPTQVALGEKVRELVTGLEGIAVRRYTFLNGCVYYGVASKPQSKEPVKFEDVGFIIQNRLERVGPGLLTKIAATPVRRTGGPMTKAMVR